MRFRLLIGFIFIFSLAGFGQSDKIFNAKGVAINGYDPVSYFLENRPVRGLDSLGTDWMGVSWKFSSRKNLELFRSDPERYAPQYGGYCAYGCSEDHRSPTDPQAFTIVGDKLYLNYNLKVKELWLKDTSSRILKANQYWKSIQ